MPNLSILENHNLEVVEQFKLLGVIFQSNLRWQANTDFLCQKAYSRLWMLRRLKSFGADQESILDVYHKQVRCVLELNVAVWEPGLNQAQIKQLERVQKWAFYVIMGDQYFDYESAVKSLKSDKLSDRRIKLCLKFANKCEKSTKFSNWFEPAEIITQPLPGTRSDKTAIQRIYKAVTVRTDRYRDSPIPYLTELLEDYHQRKIV